MRQLLFTALAATVTLAVAAPARAADPTTGDCLSANNAAIDLRNDHKLRSARTQLLVCAAATCPADIRKECLHKVDETNAQIPTIIFDAKDGTGKDLTAVKVTMDGEAFADRLEGTALSADPGAHTFTFQTEGQPPVTKQLVLVEAQKERHESIVFGLPPSTPAPAPAPAPAPFVPPSEPAAHTSSGLGTQKILAIAAAGVGVVGLGVGTAFGVITMSKKSDANNVCPQSTCSSQDGVSKWSDAVSAGNVSTAMFIVGGVGLAAGAVLWFTAKSGDTQFGVGPGSLQLTRAF